MYLLLILFLQVIEKPPVPRCPSEVRVGTTINVRDHALPSDIVIPEEILKIFSMTCDSTGWKFPPEIYKLIGTTNAAKLRGR